MFSAQDAERNTKYNKAYNGEKWNDNIIFFAMYVEQIG